MLSFALGCKLLVVFFVMCLFIGTRGGVVVKALRYKPEGRGFDSQCCHWNIH
jgi:hypothetical protein